MIKLSDNKIYLASNSPRRRELLRQIGVQFELLILRGSPSRPLDVCEDVLPGELPQNYVTRISTKKAQTAWEIMMLRKLPPRPILAADTTVALGKLIHGKPTNRHEAYAMLSSLSNNTHQVLTSIAICYQGETVECTQSSEVTFCKLSKSQIDHYCDSLEPYDKAGGYAIQGYAAQFISHISGSYSGIMGLPLFETVKLLSAFGISFP